MKKDVYIKISLCFNILISLLTIASCVIMFTGFKFMFQYDAILESSRIGMLKFFTVLSNIFMGIVSTFFAYKEMGLIKGKITKIDKKYYILKLASTGAVGLTFFVVFLYLARIVDGGVGALLMNSNLFFHLIIPVLSMITFVCFEGRNDISYKETFYGILPSLLYEIYYTINVLVHMENGKVSPVYDWYWFVQNGVWTAIIVAPFMLLFTHLICLMLWKLNNLIYRWRMN